MPLNGAKTPTPSHHSLPFSLFIASLFASVMLIHPSSVSALQLVGKRALVTGSSGGIGAGIAKRLAQEGADVLVHYNTRREGAISTKNFIESSTEGTCSGIIQCDFRSPQAIRHLFEQIDEIWTDGRLDILVNNAGIVTKMASDDDDEDLSTWHETMAVNLHAPLQLSRLAKRRMKEGGVIVNVSSIHGERSVEWMTAYAASKAALDSLTRGLALEYAPDKIRVNAIAPGVCPVERTARAFEDPNVVSMWLPHLPVERLGDVESIANATLPLITNEWVTGTIWTIDGGMMARSNMPFRPRPPPPGDKTSKGAISNKSVYEEL